MNSRFEPALHSFRGFAILCVVAIHTFGFMIYYAGNEGTKLNVGLVSSINEIIFHDATIFFALISGVLFSLILADRGWVNFYKNKLFNVVTPYIFFTCLFTMFHWGFSDFTVFSGDSSEFMQASFYNLLTGGAIFTFWYLPVLLILYVSTPILMKVIRSGQWFIIPVILMPLIISRSWPEVTWSNYAYFIGVYAVGLYVGENYKYVSDKLSQHVWLLSIITLISTLILSALFYFEIEKWWFISVRETAFYIQKIALAGLALTFFKRYALHTPKLLSLLGTYAFPIFFIHGYILFELYVLLLNLEFQINNYMVLFIACLVILFLVLTTCVLLSKLCQLVFGRWSRQLIGV